MLKKEVPTRGSARPLLFRVYLIVAVLVFTVLSYFAHTTAYFPVDLSVTRALQSFRAGWFDALMRFASWVGFQPQVIVLIAVIVVGLYAAGLRWQAVAALAAAILTLVLNGLALLIVNRPRPAADLVRVMHHLKSTSYPSGHVTLLAGFLGFLIFLSFVILKRSWWRTLLIAILGAEILLVGPSRIYEGEHWLSDVLAGYLLGSLALSLSIALYRWGKPRFFTHQKRIPSSVPSGK